MFYPQNWVKGVYAQKRICYKNVVLLILVAKFVFSDQDNYLGEIFLAIYSYLNLPIKNEFSLDKNAILECGIPV